MGFEVYTVIVWIREGGGKEWVQCIVYWGLQCIVYWGWGRGYENGRRFKVTVYVKVLLFVRKRYFS